MGMRLRKFGSKFFKAHGNREEISQQKSTDEKKPTQGWFFKMVPLVGFELTTYRLQGECSTN
jgi:hypothetical protein